MQIRFLSSLILVFSFTLFTTCKKRITRYPVKMEGLWFGVGLSKNYVLEINKNSKGRMMCHGGIGCEPDMLEGKIKYGEKDKDEMIYIDKTPFWFTRMPISQTRKDSISAPVKIDPGNAIYKWYPILATMSFENKRTIEPIMWFKYKDY